jgi:hypothetical protein
MQYFATWPGCVVDDLDASPVHASGRVCSGTRVVEFEVLDALGRLLDDVLLVPRHPSVGVDDGAQLRLHA